MASRSEMDISFVESPRSRSQKHKWLLFGLLPAITVAVFLSLFFGIFYRSGSNLDFGIGVDADDRNPEMSSVLWKLDTTIDPCEDFYEFACGGFRSTINIPDNQIEVSMFTFAEEDLHRQLNDVLEEPIIEGELRAFQLAKNFYRACMDKSTIDYRGLDPLARILRQLGGWPVVTDNWNSNKFVWWETVSQLQSMGFLVDYLMNVAVRPDSKNSSYRVIRVDQPNVGSAMSSLWGDTPKLTDESQAKRSLVAYYNYLVDLAVMFGANRLTAKLEMAHVVRFYLDLSGISVPDEERRNLSLMYNPMTVAELQTQYPFASWVKYLNGMLADSVQVTSNDRVIVAAPSFFNNLTTLLEKTPARVLANYVMSQAVVGTVDYLSSEARLKKQQFQLKLTGTKNDAPPWKECTKQVSKKLWSSVGAMYVRKYVKENTKKAALNMVQNIRDQFVEILKTVDWMDNTTRERGLAKAASMFMNVAYADELLDDSKLEDLHKDLHVDVNRYLESILNVSKFAMKLVYGLLREKVSKTDSIYGSSPAVVNAFYSLSDNSIQIPAGILQGHFFSYERPSYMNYGAIGFVIGHEITHGFDDKGSQFDEQSDLVDWWQPVTKQKYLSKTECIVEQYGNYTEMYSGLKLNGINTQGENIADNGGIKEAYRAYLSWEKLHGEELQMPGLNYTPHQMFWISAAQTWCMTYRPDAARIILYNSEHSPGRFRVLGPFSNLDEFSRDFSCPLGSPMNPVNKCSVW